jgi:hypothetical protein
VTWRDIDDLLEGSRIRLDGSIIADGGPELAKIYQRAAVVACPILLLFAHRCGISAK